MTILRILIVAAVVSAGPAPVLIAQDLPADARREARDILQQLIEINTTHAKGTTTPAARGLAERFTAAGFPAADVSVIGPTGSATQNLVVRYRGRVGKKPLLLIAHLDVVEALPQDWSTDPFTLVEKDGYFYGRGTSDNKGGAATLVSAALRLKREGFVPDRDLIVALTAGEESGGDYNGIDWLLKNLPEIATVEYCINVDAGEPQLENGMIRSRPLQVAEKVSLTFQLEVTNPGGHSSLPVPENAIYRLAAGLGRVAAVRFPARLSELTRTYFTRSAGVATGRLAADLRAAGSPNAPPGAVARLSASPFYNAMLRTTCVATMLEAGHAINALPQRARAVINCRMHPLDPPDSIEAALRRALADPQIAISRLTKPFASPPSALHPALLGAVEAVSAAVTPGVPVIPYMEMGGTDSRWLRSAGIPSFGISGIPGDVDDVRAHGKDERIRVTSFYQGADFVYRLIRKVAGGG